MLFRNSFRIYLICLFAGFLPSFSQEKKAERVFFGIDVLRATDYQILQGKRIGLLTNPAGVDIYGKSTVSILKEAHQVNLVALFGPEHGIYGDEGANVPVLDKIDKNTGLPVYSLYGKYRKPTGEMLNKIDTMVIDLQDIGVRSYTYISCMRLTMEACFEQGVEVVVLDRANPLGGQKVDGPILDRNLRSYVGAFPIPYIHGLTIGELARIAKETPGWLDIPDTVRKSGILTVVPMKGWSREMTWDQTGNSWKATSPAIPSLSAVLGYAMTGLGCEINSFRHGFGTQYPFRLISHPKVEAQSLKRMLGLLPVQGLDFKVLTGESKNGQKTEGVYVIVNNWEQLKPTALSFHMMRLSCKIEGRNPYQTASQNRITLYNKHVGSNEWWEAIEHSGPNVDVSSFLKKWDKEASDFQAWSQKFQIYE
ncbi:MAG: DUF1343 domain-containing protein [Opitutales bacterium]|nr:DUF1343 domain-containing protein [Opitutales bacterium]